MNIQQRTSILAIPSRKQTFTNASVHWNHLYLVMVRVLTHVTLRHALSYIPTHDCLNISTRKVVRAFLMIYQCTWSLASLENVAHFAAILLLDKFRNDAQPRRECVICILESIPSPLSAIILLFIDHFLDNQLQV